MKLYSTTGAPNPRRVRIFLAEKDIDVPIQELSIMEAEHKTEEYRKISPSSRVPALVLDDGTVILESVAICRYFELLNPDPALFGKTELEQAIVEMQSRRMEMELMMSVAGTFRHTHPAFSELENQIPEFGNAQKKIAEKRLNLLNKELEDQEFIAGSNYSMADITALCAIDFCVPARIEISEDYEHLQRWIKAVKSRPSSEIM